MFAYLLLFEFILEANKIFPKPSILFESVSHIFPDYNLLSALAYTISAIYIGIILAYMIIWFLKSWIIKILVEFEKSVQLLQLFSNLTIIFVLLLFAFWFDDKYIGSILISFLIALFLSIQKMNELVKNVRNEYLIVARNLNRTASQCYAEVSWKSIQPDLITNFIKVHYLLWSFVIVYEFISSAHGLGSIYQTIYTYHDFAAFVTVSIVVSIIIWFGKLIIRFVKQKYFFWD